MSSFLNRRLGWRPPAMGQVTNPVFEDAQPLVTDTQPLVTVEPAPTVPYGQVPGFKLDKWLPVLGFLAIGAGLFFWLRPDVGGLFTIRRKRRRRRK